MQSYINKLYFLVFASALIYFGGCEKERPKKDYVARVNNSYLTKEELNSLVDSTSTQNIYKTELIRNWINNEVLYQKALKEGITDGNKFNRVIENSKKELAVTLLLEKIYSENETKPDIQQIDTFFNNHKDEFKLFYDAFVINLINFNNEDKAIKYRATLLESDWKKALNVFKGDSSIINSETSNLVYEYELQSAAITRTVKELNPGEVSIVFHSQPRVYSVVQLIQRIEKNSIPPLEYIRQQVEKRIIAEKKEEFYKNYLNELYSNNDIEVKN